MHCFIKVVFPPPWSERPRETCLFQSIQTDEFWFTNSNETKFNFDLITEGMSIERGDSSTKLELGWNLERQSGWFVYGGTPTSFSDPFRVKDLIVPWRSDYFMWIRANSTYVKPSATNLRHMLFHFISTYMVMQLRQHGNYPKFSKQPASRAINAHRDRSKHFCVGQTTKKVVILILPVGQLPPSFRL